MQHPAGDPGQHTALGLGAAGVVQPGRSAGGVEERRAEAGEAVLLVLEPAPQRKIVEPCHGPTEPRA
ncbi:hypothetical protein [Nocardioides convexus]|uniref:hypothetical protein n=1 Tax=Nocardioides convexus TaxID=2712224 RepID=UPI0024182534|nr:hypothetical protein [Nocardioides convexus]